MDLDTYLKEKKTKLICMFFCMLLILSLVLRNYISELYPLTIFLAVLIFILSQYFDFEYRYLIIFALALLSACTFLLIARYERLVEYFANYTYVFLVLGVVGYFLDNLRDKLKKRDYFKIYRLVFLSLLILVLISPFVIYREYIPKLPDIIKHANYYIKKESVKLNDSQIVENIIITVENPTEDSQISGKIKISGWAIEGNSQDSSGIDRIEIFIDGRPGIGTYINDVSNIKEEDNKLADELVNRLYRLCYNKDPDNLTVSYWRYKLESGEVLFSDMARNFILSEEFKNRNLSNEEYLNVLYRALLNREPDRRGYNYWLNKLKKGLDRDTLLDEFLNSVEVKGLSRSYYNKIASGNEAIEGINLPREDIRNSYGEQFNNSGFNFKFNSLMFDNGKHTIYVYAHNPYFGWNYVSFDIHIDN